MTALIPTLKKLFSIAFHENGQVVAEATKEKFIHYAELLQKWNRVFNLTTLVDGREMVYWHFMDSLSIAPFLCGTKMLDVGSGAGFPGVPLALIHPEVSWVLLEKNAKKTRFLMQVIAELELKNVEIAPHRGEDFSPSTGFDTIVSRAFGTLRAFVELATPWLREKGVFLAMKGKYPEEELRGLPNTVKIQQVVRLHIRGVEAERHLICLERA